MIETRALPPDTDLLALHRQDPQRYPVLHRWRQRHAGVQADLIRRPEQATSPRRRPGPSVLRFICTASHWVPACAGMTSS